MIVQLRAYWTALTSIVNEGIMVGQFNCGIIKYSVDYVSCGNFTKLLCPNELVHGLSADHLVPPKDYYVSENFTHLVAADALYENFRRALIDGLGEKYRHLRHNTSIYHNYQFHIEQIRQPRNQQDTNGRLIEPHLNGFGFSGPDEPLIEQYLLRFQDETHFITVNMDNRTFQLTEQGIRHLREQDPSLEPEP